MAKDRGTRPATPRREPAQRPVGVGLLRVHGEHIFDADLSVSVPMLDSLMEPRGVIADAQAMRPRRSAAAHVLCDERHVHREQGDLQTLLAPGEKLLLDRNCHKSVHHGVVLSRRAPIYLNSSVTGSTACMARSEAHDPRGDRGAPRRAGADPYLLHLRRPALRPRVDRRSRAREGIKVIIDEACTASRASTRSSARPRSRPAPTTRRSPRTR